MRESAQPSCLIPELRAREPAKISSPIQNELTARIKDTARQAPIGLRRSQTVKFR